jgi:hypothetical protein
MIKKIADWFIGLWINKNTKIVTSKRVKLSHFLIEDYEKGVDGNGNWYYRLKDDHGFVIITEYIEYSDMWRILITYDKYTEAFWFSREILETNFACIVYNKKINLMKENLLEIKRREREFLMGKIMGSSPKTKI